MIYLINALAFGFIAVIWDKKDAPNIFVALFFTALTVFNAAYASPFVFQLLGAKP